MIRQDADKYFVPKTGTSSITAITTQSTILALVNNFL